jgi:hypothetical protein
LRILFQGIVEKYDLMAEQQRQIRDDETKTIERKNSGKSMNWPKVLDEGAEKEKAEFTSPYRFAPERNKNFI